MSDELPFEQLFEFESAAITLDDGSIFQPLSDAVARLKPLGADASYRMRGSYLDVIYQINEDEFVHVEASSPCTLDCAETFRIIPNDGRTRGRRIHARQVVRFLLENEQEVPDFLQSALNELNQPTMCSSATWN